MEQQGHRHAEPQSEPVEPDLAAPLQKARACHGSSISGTVGRATSRTPAWMSSSITSATVP